MPYLAFLYKVKGGEKAGLPHNYFRLLGIVWITWWMFPAWWLLPFEGVSIIKDTKLNAVGFAVLNVLSKGAFTFQIISMVKYHRAKKELQEKGITDVGNKGGKWSVNTLPGDNPGEQMTVVRRNTTRKETPLVWMLRPFDDTAGNAHVSERTDTSAAGWHALEKPYRCFLLGKDIFPSDYAKKSELDKQELRAEFKYVFELVTVHVAGPPTTDPGVSAENSAKDPFFSV